MIRWPARTPRACSTSPVSWLVVLGGLAVLGLIVLGAGAWLLRSDPGDEAPQETVSQAAEAWLAEPTNERALAIVDAVVAAGRADDGPYLVDLARTTGSSVVRAAALDGLGSLSGLAVAGDPNAAYVELGSWALDRRPRPSGPYPAFKATAYGRIDAPFADLLQLVDDVDTLVGLQWGGVPVGGIVALTDPARVAPERIEWAEADEIVFEVTVGEQRVGYPLRIIGRHELSNDHLTPTDGGAPVPFGVSYCSLCRTAVAFDRRIDDRTLTFQTSGLLLEANKVMVDDETGTLWRQATGEAIAGPLAGRRLTLLDTRLSSFEAIELTGTPIVDLPRPFLIDAETGTLTTYAYTVDEPLAEYLAAGRLWFPTVGPAGEPDPLDRVATVVVDGRPLAIAPEAVRDRGAAILELGERPTAAVAIGMVDGWVRAFDVTDLPETERQAVLAALRQDRLDVDATVGATELPVGAEAWFAWRARHPDTERWTG